MDRHLEGTWEEFENWIKGTIESDFTWRVRPRDTRENREMVASVILKDIKRNDGVFPETNAFVKRTKRIENQKNKEMNKV